MPKISVIVPVYNVEKYLSECIESILTQSYFDFELLLVDDGSTDDSPLICDRYASVDNRIRVIHGENKGVSSARNQGIRYSTGEYITFVDADDLLLPNALKILVETMNSNDVDFVRFSSVQEINKTSNQKFDVYIFNDGLEKIEFASKLHFLAGNQVWGCAFKLSLIKQKNIYFVENGVNVYEDMYFSILYALNSSSALISREPVYYYRSNPSSTTHITAKMFFFNVLNDYSFRLFKNNEYYLTNKYHNILHYSILDQGLYSFGLPSTGHKAKLFVDEIDKIVNKKFFFEENKLYFKTHPIIEKTSLLRLLFQKSLRSFLSNGRKTTYIFKVSLIDLLYKIFK